MYRVFVYGKVVIVAQICLKRVLFILSYKHLLCRVVGYAGILSVYLVDKLLCINHVVSCWYKLLNKGHDYPILMQNSKYLFLKLSDLLAWLLDNPVQCFASPT